MESGSWSVVQGSKRRTGEAMGCLPKQCAVVCCRGFVRPRGEVFRKWLLPFLLLSSRGSIMSVDESLKTCTLTSRIADPHGGPLPLLLSIVLSS